MPDLDSYVKLMCHFNGTDGSTTIVDDYSDKTITVNGNAQLDTAQKKFGSASLLLDGTGDYLSIADNADFNFGSGDFTIDCQIRFNSLPGSGAYACIFAQRATATSQNSLGLFIKNNSGVYELYASFTYDGTTEKTLVMNYPFTTGTWYHIEICREGNWLGYFVDGENVGSYYVGTNSLHDSTAEFKIGGSNSTTTNYFNGWIDEFRLSKGIARHTLVSFTPSTTEYTADAYDKLLLHMDGTDNSTTFTDSATSRTVTANGNAKLKTSLFIGYFIEDSGDTGHLVALCGNATISATSKFGTGSLSLDGNGDYVSIADSADFNFGSGDFTVDCQIRFAQVPSSYHCIFSQRGSQTSQHALALYATSTGLLLTFTYNGSSEITLTASKTFTTGTWYHIAIIRNSTSLSIFVDGVSLNSYNISTNSLYDSTAAFKIGVTDNSNIYGFNGYIDEFRVSKGIARWTSNFTAPSSEYTSDSYTKLLLHCEAIESKTVYPKIGTAMGYFDGTDDYLSMSDSDDFVFDGDFTIDFWVNFNSLVNANNYSTLYQQRDGLHSGYCFDLGIAYDSGDGTCNISTGYSFQSAPGELRYAGNDIKIPLYNWNHIAIQRDGEFLRLFCNGVCVGTKNIGSGALYNSTASILIGDSVTNGGVDFYGFFDEYRVSKGIARFTPASFTPPTEEYGGITAPVVTTTDPITLAKDYSAVVAGEVTSDGGATVTQRGFCYSTSPTPTTSDSKITVSGTTGAFSGEIFGLALSTTYHVRAYAINSVGTGYGDDVDFTTTNSAVAPSVTTVTPLIQILDYADTLTVTASTTSATILFATTAGLSVDDFIVNTTRNNTSRRVDAIPSAGIHDLNATIPNQAQDDEIRTYKFTDHSDLIKQETLTFTERVQGGGDLAFQMVTDGTYIPRAGQYIRLYLNNTLYFTGMINTVTRRLPQDGITTKIFFDVTATQLKIIPPRRTVTLNYDIDTTCSTIVSDMINSYLVDEGFMAGTVNDGVKLSEQWLDDCISIGDILDQCANLSGFQWYVDENFDLQFMQDPTTVTTCTYVISDLTNSFTDFRNVTVEETIDNYTNKVFIAGGNDQNGNLVIVGQQTTASILEMQNYSAGSGVWGKVERNSSETKAEYEVAEAGTSATTVVLGTATMASITLTVGDEIRNDTRDVRSTVASITVTSFDVLTAITGQTAGDDIVIYSNSNQVARNILKRQDQIPKRISFDTFTLGFRAGQELQVALSSLSMSTTASYIVEEVNISHVADRYFRSTIRAILRNADNLSTQKNPDTWDFFKGIGASASKRSGYGPQRGAINPKVTVSTTTPSNPKVNDIFMRTSPTPSVQFWYNGSSWVE